MFQNKSNRNAPPIRYLLHLFLVAIGVNFIWEMAQMPLYENMPFDDPISWWLCFRASIGDGVIILTIWGIGAAIFRRVIWFRPLALLNTGVLLLSGGAIAVGIEVHALATNRWAYSELMPMLPYVEVGLSPFLQLLLLPWICMALSAPADS